MAAIYQWFEGVIEYQTWTTTLYPLEASEGLKFTVDLNYVIGREIPEDAMDIAPSQFVSGSKAVILLSAPQKDDAMDIAPSQFVSGSKAVILLSAPQKDDAMDIAPSQFVSGSKNSKLITIYSPDHGLLFTADLDTANCDMVPV